MNSRIQLMYLQEI